MTVDEQVQLNTGFSGLKCFLDDYKICVYINSSGNTDTKHLTATINISSDNYYAKESTSVDQLRYDFPHMSSMTKNFLNGVLSITIHGYRTNEDAINAPSITTGKLNLNEFVLRVTEVVNMIYYLGRPRTQAENAQLELEW